MYQFTLNASALMVFLAYERKGYYMAEEMKHARRAYLKERALLGGEVLTVTRFGLPVATMMCSRDKGWLPTDDPFPTKMSELRSQYGNRIGYYGKFAVWPWLNGSGFGEKLILQAIYWTCEQQLDLAIMMVHPRHVRRYRRLGAEVLGRTDGTVGLEKAPAVLLAIKVKESERVQELWREELSRRTNS